MFTSTVVFPVVKLVESAFEQQGYEFKVGDAWKCDECFEAPPDHKLCSSCRARWVNEVGHINYTDYYEKCLNQTMGAAGLVLGSTAMLANASLDLWTPGPVAYKITMSLASYVPDTLRLSPFSNFIYEFILVSIAGMALSVLFMGFAMAGFMMAISPNSQRHWRHMTPSATALSILMGGYWAYLGLGGTVVGDMALVYGPASFGACCFLLVLCMRESVEEKTEALEKFDVEEKIVI